MPFASKAQRRFLFAKKPEVAKEFAKEHKAAGNPRIPEKKRFARFKK